MFVKYIYNKLYKASFYYCPRKKKTTGACAKIILILQTGG